LRRLLSYSDQGQKHEEIMGQKPFFVLGAADPEMEEIIRVLNAEDFGWVKATCLGQAVDRPDAYEATSVDGLLPRDHENIVFVECRVLGLTPAHICDHHNPGDPGYDKPPRQYMEGSSLGQVLSLIGKEPTDQQRIIAAADHCLAHAYSGLCPGVSREVLADWRERSRASRFDLTLDDIRLRISIAEKALDRAPRQRIANEDVAYFADKDVAPYEIFEASARCGKPILYVAHLEHKNTRYKTKMGLINVRPQTVEAWMRDCGLEKVYGAPLRGYAGGYAR